MKRTVEVATQGTRLFVKEDRLVVARDGAVVARIPMEDVGLLVLDSVGVTVSSGVLRSLSDHGGALLTCGEKHLPTGLLLPVTANSVHVERIRHQASASLPLRKNLWAAMVRRKIRNQAGVLREVPAAEGLRRMAAKVRSGDAGNVEARAARQYWSALFDGVLPAASRAFRRGERDVFPNPLLNYGYAVLRAATARALCGAGLHPCLGIHHHNRYAGFTLADDVMEPFRPWVDAAVLGLVRAGQQEMDKEAKVGLLGVLTAAVKTTSGVGPLLVALERASATLAQALELAYQGSATAEAVRVLDLPSWPREQGG